MQKLLKLTTCLRKLTAGQYHIPPITAKCLSGGGNGSEAGRAWHPEKRSGWRNCNGLERRQCAFGVQVSAHRQSIPSRTQIGRLVLAKQRVDAKRSDIYGNPSASNDWRHAKPSSETLLWRLRFSQCGIVITAISQSLSPGLNMTVAVADWADATGIESIKSVSQRIRRCDDGKDEGA
jgi:hypothetical protein